MAHTPKQPNFTDVTQPDYVSPMLRATAPRAVPSVVDGMNVIHPTSASLEAEHAAKQARLDAEFSIPPMPTATPIMHRSANNAEPTFVTYDEETGNYGTRGMGFRRNTQEDLSAAEKRAAAASWMGALASGNATPGKIAGELKSRFSEGGKMMGDVFSRIGRLPTTVRNLRNVSYTTNPDETREAAREAIDLFARGDATDVKPTFLSTANDNGVGTADEFTARRSKIQPRSLKPDDLDVAKYQPNNGLKEGQGRF